MKKNLTLLFLILFLSPAAVAQSSPQTVALKGNVPAANANFDTAKTNDLMLRSQNCLFVDGDPCSSAEIGLIRHCTGTGMIMCGENRTWGSIGGSSVWKKIINTPIITSIVDNIPDGIDLQVGINTENPRANLHLYAQSPIRDNTSLMLQHDAVNNSTWSWVVEDHASEEGILILNGQLTPSTQNDKLLAVTHAGDIFLSDNFDQHFNNPAHAKFNIQSNIDAITQTTPAISIDPEKLALILSMNSTDPLNSAATPVNGEGTGIGFSTSDAGNISSAIVAEHVGGVNNLSRLHFLVKRTAASPLTSAMTITQAGKVILGSQSIGTNNDRLSVEGDFAIRGNINMTDNSSGRPNTYSLTGLKTETLGANNNNAATTEFVQNTVAAAAASGSCMVFQTKINYDTAGGQTMTSDTSLWPNYCLNQNIPPFNFLTNPGQVFPGCRNINPNFIDVPNASYPNGLVWGEIFYDTHQHGGSISAGDLRYFSCYHVCCFP